MKHFFACLWSLIIIINMHFVGLALTENQLDLKSESLSRDAKVYLQALSQFADNAIKHGKDVYGPKQTPLFVDGLNVDTLNPVKWKYTNGEEWVLIDLGNQQNFFRTLCGLSALTGNPKYKNAAAEATRYALQNVRDGELMAWGGHMAYNASKDRITFAEDKSKVHELKNHYPFYELMWEVDPQATRSMMENIWNSHILDWSNLDFNRHGVPQKMGDLWENTYEGGEVFFWGKGLTFLNAGSDLYYAASLLSQFTNDPKPLTWAKRLAHRYVETRNPKTGIGGFQFSQSASAWCNGPEIRGDRAQYQYGEDFPGHLVVEGTLFPCYGNTPLAQSQICNLTLFERLGEQGQEFKQWAIEELTAWGKVAYRKEDNSFIPMLTDGTSMEGYVCKKEGYFGPKGRVLTAGKAGPEEFWVYAKAYQLSSDQFMWEMTRNIAKANRYGDIGASVHDDPSFDHQTSCADYEVLFGFLALYQKTGHADYLDISNTIGKNILKAHFNKGFFTKSKNHPYARFDAVEPLALLQLTATIQQRIEVIPIYPGGEGFYAASYGDRGHQYDDNFIYGQVRK